jgi:hypothetical protein
MLKLHVYYFVLLVLFSSLSFMLVSRSDIKTTLLRAAGTIYQLRDDGTVSNLYNAELVNKTTNWVKFEMKPVDSDTKIQYVREKNIINKGSSVKVTFFVIRSQKRVNKYKSEIEIEIWSDGKFVDKIKTNFIAPPYE